MAVPNVVLVIFNLVFFVPSAVRVYESLHFLKRSVAHSRINALEKERISAIFRLFILMEFYTIPRIIHWIVDSDQASPELLMISVSLYMLIGPGVFYFFVCKRDTINLIKKNLPNIESIGNPVHFSRSNCYHVGDLSSSIMDSGSIKYFQE